MGSIAQPTEEPPAPDPAVAMNAQREETTATERDNSSGVEMEKSPHHPAFRHVLFFPPLEPPPASALFSTDFGRRPKRVLQDPLAPVVVHTPKYETEHVRDYALYLKGRYPYEYMNFLPDSHWTIEDLFDDVEIHVQGRDILEKVMAFICHDNAAEMRKFAKKWALKDRERMDRVGRLVYTSENPYTVVPQLFVDGETTEYPTHFLWHAANFMRRCFNSCVVNSTSTSKGDKTVNTETQKSPKGDDSLVNSANLDTQAGSGVVSERNKPSEGAEKIPRRGSQNMAPTHSVSEVQTSPEPSDKKQLLPKEELATIPEGPRLKNPNVGKQKARDRQHSSGSYNQPENKGWAENVGMRPQPHPPYPNVGPPSMNQPYLFNPPQEFSSPPHNMAPPMPNFGAVPTMPASLPPMLHPFGPGPAPVQQLPPLFAGKIPMSAYTLSNPPTFPQAVQGRVPYPGGQHGPLQGPDQQFQPSGPLALPMTDPTISGPPFQTPDSRPRGGRPDKQQGLYNPYGAMRPDFADIPPQQMKRRTSRGTLSYNQGAKRPRGQSLGSYNHCSDPILSELGGPIPVQMRGGQTVVNPSDQVVGCGENWIGPGNETVRDLVVFDVPHNLNEVAIYDFFVQVAGVFPSSVRVRMDRRQKLIATVRFASVGDARRGLLLNGKVLGGKEVAVKVPSRYFAPLAPGARSFSNNHPGSRAVSASYQVPMMTGSVVPTMQPAATYSPQDARSDLLKGRNPEKSAASGSPEKRKTKKSNKSPSKESVAASDNGPAPKKTAPASAQTPRANGGQHEVSPDAPRNADDVKETQSSLKEGIVDAECENEAVGVPNASGTESGEIAVASEAIIGEAEPSQTHPDVSASDSEDGTPRDGASIPAATGEKVSPDVSLPAENAHQRTVSLANRAIESSNIKDETLDIADENKRIKVDVPSTHALTRRDLTSTNVGSPRPDDANSEEEQRETSFHSAREAQSDSGKDDAKQETAAARDISQRSPPSPQTLHTSVSVTTSGRKMVGDAVTNPPPPQPQPESTTALAANSAPPESKKGGAKQTEPMFPYAKSKMQLKQERQQKKKEKKKAKSNKPAPSTNDVEGTISKVEMQHSAHTSRPGTPPALPDQPPQAQGSLPTPPTERNPQEVIAIPVVKKEDKTGGKSTQSGKDVEVIQSVETRKQEAHTPNAGDSGVQSSKDQQHDTATLSAQDLRDAAAGDTQKQPSSTKSTFFKPAVPIFNLLQKKTTSGSKAASSGSSAATEPASPRAMKGTSDVAGSTLTKSSEADTVLYSLKDRRHIDTTSIPSSSALLANISPPFSPSPTAAEFHTPLQTPSALAPPSQELPKKGKSKKKSKKKKKVAIATSESGEEPAPVQSQAFSEQIQVVDTLKALSVSPPRNLPKPPTEPNDEGGKQEVSITKSLKTVTEGETHPITHSKADDVSNADGKSTKAEKKKHDRFLREIELYERERDMAFAAIPKDILEQEGIPYPKTREG